ncbi:MAG: hypothetical protein JRH08_02360 [Deltaproteobacteria bacterium]|nr:hypothetical protein [Deltaproteobacteria bacterium]MBW1929794.1 hypothetical protein [Deltaproteobacteria bacterium]MBW2024440.1 hypothetical protein [Deltaproteobacteria bacterium]MBW2124542.1 hypothetical protein [Deltaproteobacteria bacterium]RLB12630.1 MAG: hypothetical protein DRG63_11420 [Deltaproteobacteria bacterium]
MPKGFRKTNHLAIVGFLLPFGAGGLVALLVALVQKEFLSLKFLVPYLTLVPLLLCSGIVCAIRSIPLIEERNDKDYAYSGLTLNVLFLIIYIISLIYFFGIISF